MSSLKVQKTASFYKGWPQPDPDERLAQIRIFLADEDYHRTLRFTQKLAEIEEYVAHLGKNDCDFDKRLLNGMKDMIHVHKNWIKSATQGPSASYSFALYVHKNRLLGLVKDHKRRAQIACVKAPKLLRNLTPGPALHKCVEKEDRPASPDPFLYTKRLAEIRRRQDTEAEQVAKNEQSAVWQKLVPTSFNGPYTYFYKLAGKDIIERRNILLQTVKRLREAAKLAPRPFINEVISIMTRSTKGVQDKTFEHLESSLTNEDLQHLLTLAEPSWNTEVKRAMRELSEDGSLQSAMFAQLMELFNSDLWPEQNSAATLEDVFNRLKSGEGGKTITVADLETFIVEMNEIGNIRYNVASQVVRKPLLDQHPEDSLPKEQYRAAAQRFGFTAAHLESLLQDKEGNQNRSFLRDTSSILSIKQKVEKKYPLPRISPTLLKLQELSPSQEQHASLLQQQMILENCHNWDDRVLNFQSLWAFAFSIENTRRFFTLDRWPPELQTGERRTEIWESGPAPLSPERYPKDDFPRPKENETFYPGETFFPFGETPYHEALLARQIDLVRPDGPTRQPSNSDPFALPEFPESEIPGLMDYAAELGLLKRKRLIEDDDSSHASKAVYVTDHHATRDAALSAEQATASPYPSPEFLSEVVGGVELRVAESTAGKGRRRVRFIAPGAGVESSDSSSRAGRSFLRPTLEQLGWYGNKVGAELKRVRGEGDDSGGSGTTASQSARGQGWIRRPKAASSSNTKSSEAL